MNLCGCVSEGHNSAYNTGIALPLTQYNVQLTPNKNWVALTKRDGFGAAKKW